MCLPGVDAVAAHDGLGQPLARACGSDHEVICLAKSPSPEARQAKSGQRADRAFDHPKRGIHRSPVLVRFHEVLPFCPWPGPDSGEAPAISDNPLADMTDAERLALEEPLRDRDLVHVLPAPEGSTGCGTDRHCVSAIHVRLVFVTKCPRGMSSRWSVMTARPKEPSPQAVPHGHTGNSAVSFKSSSRASLSRDPDQQKEA